MRNMQLQLCIVKSSVYINALSLSIVLIIKIAGIDYLHAQIVYEFEIHSTCPVVAISITVSTALKSI